MDPAILSATSALAGSLIGAASSFATTWFTQCGQLRALARAQEATKREALYAEFIAETAKRIADGLTRQAESAEVIVGLHAAVGRMRLTSSREVVRAAEKLVRFVVETYSSPNLTFEQLRESVTDDFSDPMEEFGEACRMELQTLRDQQL